MLPLLRVGLSLSTFCAASLLAVYVLVLVRTPSQRKWPDLSSPWFDLEPGAIGSWDLEWPDGGPAVPWSQLLLVVDPVVEPGAVDVTVLAEPAEGGGTSHAFESIGVVSPWIWRNVGVLPAKSHRPLLIDDRVERLSWTVTRVGATATGARARIALSGAPIRSRWADDRVRVLTIVLPATVFAFALLGFRIATGIRRRSARAALEGGALHPRNRLASIVVTVLGCVVLVASFSAALALVVVACAFTRRQVRDTHLGSRVTGRGGGRGPVFTLVPGTAGVWSPERDAHPELAGHVLLWLGTDHERETPRADAFDVRVRVEPPDAAWSFDPGPAPESGEWRLGPSEDEGRALVVDPRRVDSLTWRVESVAPEWNGGWAWLATCGDCEHRQATDGVVR